MKAAWLLALATLWVAPIAEARIERFAVVAGNNVGAETDEALRYAHGDAEKVAAALGDVGDFPPANVVLLRGNDAATLRSTLIAVNDRVRSAASLPGVQTLLFVYYSGHADAEFLHLGGSELALSELAQLVRGSAATFRLLVLDACRSGAVTRRKGGRVDAPFAIEPEARLTGEGMAFITASAENEDAQESDELRGSFFTHAFVSGLLGAADVDGDGQVVLEEAYRHAYDATLRSTSRTFGGVQHPTFRYDLRGQDAVVLARTKQRSLGEMHFPDGLGFLVVSGGAEGPVVGEVAPSGSGRKLALRPGKYFLRARGRDELFEGQVELAANESLAVDTSGFRRVAYAQLVRKGRRSSGLAHGPELGASVRSALPNADSPCIGPLLGYRVEWPALSAYARLMACRNGFDNETVEATTTDVGLTLHGVRAFDFESVTLGVGVSAGFDVMHQNLATRGRAPNQLALVPLLGIMANAALPLGGGLFAELDVFGEAHFMNVQDSAAQAASSRPVLSARAALLIGKSY